MDEIRGQLLLLSLRQFHAIETKPKTGYFRGGIPNEAQHYLAKTADGSHGSR